MSDITDGKLHPDLSKLDFTDNILASVEYIRMKSLDDTKLFEIDKGVHYEPEEDF